MRLKIVIAALALFSTCSLAFAVDGAGPANLSAADVVARNVASRGGLAAWRKVQSLAFEGKLGAGGNQRGTLPSPEVAAVSRRIPQEHRLSEEDMLPFT